MQVTEPQVARPPRLRRWRVALAGPALLLLIYVGFYWKLTLTKQYTWLESPDMANQVLPWFQFQAGEWHKGHFPIWDPFEWAGQSLIGQAQPGVAYPPNWILFLMPLRDGWMRQTYLHWYFVLIHYMAGLFCYLLCRDLKLGRPASLLAGAAFGITGWMGSTDWPQMLNGGVWAPIVFLFLLRVVRGQRTLVSGALAGTFLGVAFLSGHHQIPIYITLSSGGVWLYCIFRDRRGRASILQAAALFGLFLVLVSALQMLPAYEYGKLAERWVGANDPVGWNTPVPYSVHTNFGFYPSSLIGMLLPGIARNANAYVTMTIAALAFLAIVCGWRDRMVRIMASVALGGLIFSFSGFAVLHGIVYALVPMVEKARSASFGIFIFHFGVITLSAFAVDLYLKTPEFWVRRVAWSLTGICVTVFFLELAISMTQVPRGYDYDRMAAAACYGLLLAALLYAWRYGHIQPNTGIALAILLVLLQAGLETGFAWPNKEKPSEYLKKMSENTDIVDFIRKQPKFVRLEVDDQEIPYNFNDWQGFDSLNGYLASLTTNIGHVQGDYRARMVFGVNLWIGKKPLRENQQELFVGKSGLKIYLNPEAYPETWIVHDAVGIRSDAVLDTFQKYDLQQMRGITFVPELQAPKLDKCSAQEWSEVTRRSSTGVTIEATLGCTGMVILDDAYYPGWEATVDGAPAQIHEAYGMIRGVVASAGRHRIEMKYRPKSVYLGALLTGLGFLGACLLAKFGSR